MATRYTKRDRATAIRICQIAALTHDLHDSYGSVAMYLGLGGSYSYSVCRSRPAYQLALAAWEAIERRGVHVSGSGEVDGEAECLLRDGWSPGERIKRLGGAR